ncbi:MAG TPA: CocE/NonD family hydrolase [Terriglobia bacterium]|jgi:putative CocE/NonD family hydrolase|nr:CocE/NonD family hydrolase [Terriglobia bacterium]
MTFRGQARTARAAAIPCFAAIILLATAKPPAASQAADESAGAFTVSRNVMVPMRDGVRLATDVYFPAKGGVRLEGKFPAILERTPYNKEGSIGYLRPYVAQGYVVVSQDTRGRHASEGVWHMMTDDVNDGYDTAQWLVRQDWSDGGFGMIGTSYPGGTQHAMAESNPPGLKAVVPVCAVADAGYYGMRNGGAFELRFFNWIFSLGAPDGSRASRDPGTRAALQEMENHRRDYLLALPLRPGMTPLRLAPEYEQWLTYAMGHGENDTYWKQPGFDVTDQVARYKDVPVYLIGGWYDSWALQTTRSYMALARGKHGPIKMILGPWIHGEQMHHANGQVEFGPEAAIDDTAFHLRWYDRWLKGAENGADREAPVKIFVMGGGSEEKTADGRHLHGGVWRDEQEWPLARTRWTSYYLHADGTLSEEKPAEAANGAAYDFDPHNPVPTIGGNISSGNGIMLQGAWDQRCGEAVWNCRDSLPLSARKDVLVFMTPPLEQDVEVTGPIDVKLWASSSAPDTDFTAKLIDVHPPSQDFPGGIDMNLEDGIIRARFRNSLERAELMKPGAIYPFTIHLYPTSNVFKKGHRIRVDVSSSNFPRFDVNPNTGEPLNANRRTAIATNTIYHDRQHPSAIVLPVIPH